MSTTPAASPAELEAARIAIESCDFPLSGPDPPLLSTNQIISVTAVLIVVAWRYTAIFIRRQKDKSALAEGREIEDEEHSLKRTDGSKVVFCDCGKGGPIDVWMWIITKLPCLALAIGVLLPALLSYEGLRQSGFTMDIDMDFAGYVKTETQMQLHEDALTQAKKCRVSAIEDSQKRRRLHSLGFEDAFSVNLEGIHPGLLPELFEDGAANAFPSGLEVNYNRTSSESRVLASKKKGRPYWTLDVFYEAAGVGGGGVSASPFGEAAKSDFGVFTKTRLEEIREFEKEVLAYPGYEGHDMKNRIYEQCWRFVSSKNPCELPQSPVNIFFGSTKVNRFGNGTSGAFDGKGPLNDIESVLKNLLQENIFIFTDTKFSEDHLTSSFTRTRFRGHGPGAHKFLENLHNNLFKREQDPATRKYKSLRITWSESSHLKTYEVMSALAHDAMYALGSFTFVGVFVVLHLRSLLLASFAIYGILISFPAAYYFFFVTMAYRKMMILNFVSLFLIMGIGADDVFVMFDAYNQAAAALGPRSSPGQRLRWAYLEAGSAMLVTTVTTAGSFFSNCVSEVVVVRQFGFFMGSVVVLNWLHVMVIFPSFLLIYEIWWGRCWKHCCCCCHRFCPTPDYDDDDDEYDDEDEDDEDEDEGLNAEDTAAQVERRHEEENAARLAEQEARQKAQHERLQNRLHRRNSNKTDDDDKTKQITVTAKITKSPVAKEARKTGRMALLAKKKNKKRKKRKDTDLLEDIDKVEGELDLTHLGGVERCFNKCFSPFLYTFRFPLCLSMIVIAIVGALMIIENFTPGDAPTIFLEDKNLGRLQRIMEESGLGDLSISDEMQVMRQYPTKPFVRPTCPGLLPDGLTYCNGRGTCKAAKLSTKELGKLFGCIEDPSICGSEEAYRSAQKQVIEDFACKCETAYSGYNCSKVSTPGNIFLVRNVRGTQVDRFSTSTYIPPAPEIQILIYGENKDAAQEVVLLNMGDYKVNWELAGIAKIGSSVNQNLPAWLTTDIQLGEIPAASYLTSDGLPLPGMQRIKFQVDGTGKKDGWYNQINGKKQGAMFVQINDITTNRPKHHSNFTIATKYVAEFTAWAPEVGKLNQFQFAYETDITNGPTEVSDNNGGTLTWPSTTNKILIKKVGTNWDSKNPEGVWVPTVDAIIVEVEKKWDGVVNQKRIMHVSTHTNQDITEPIEISVNVMSEDIGVLNSATLPTICKVFVTISSNNYQTNDTTTYNIQRSSPKEPGQINVKSLHFDSTKNRVVAIFALPNSPDDLEANINAFKPTLNIMKTTGGNLYEVLSSFPIDVVNAAAACSATDSENAQWGTQDQNSIDCSIVIAFKNDASPNTCTGRCKQLTENVNLLTNKAFEVIIRATNGVKDSDPSTPFGKPKERTMKNEKKIYSAVWYQTSVTKPSISLDAITVNTHKNAIYAVITIGKILPGSHSPLSFPMCAIKKSTGSGGSGGSEIIKNCTKTIENGKELATVLFADLDGSNYDIECWCDSAAGSGKTDFSLPTKTNVPSTIPALDASAFNPTEWQNTYEDYGDAAVGALTPSVQAKLVGVKVDEVTSLQTKCCRLKVVCNCEEETNDEFSSTLGVLQEGINEITGIVIKNIRRGSSTDRSSCTFSCFTQLIVKPKYLTGGTNVVHGLTTYTIEGTKAQTSTLQEVPLEPPSPPIACESSWANKEVITVSEATLQNWPSVYKSTDAAGTARLNISDVVIPMQRDLAKGEITKFTCELSCEDNCISNAAITSNGWVAMSPNDPTSDGSYIAVIYQDTSVYVGAQYTAKCWSWGGGGRSDKTDVTKVLTINQFTVGAVPPAPKLETVMIKEVGTRDVGFKVHVRPTHHNPPVSSYTCTTTTTGSAIVQTINMNIITGLKYSLEAATAACQGSINLGVKETVYLCAVEAIKNAKCASGNGRFHYSSTACDCCTTSTGSTVGSFGTDLYKLNDVVLPAMAAESTPPSDVPSQTVCKAGNSVGFSVDSNEIGSVPVLPPIEPTNVVISDYSRGINAITIAVTSVNSNVDTGGLALTKKTCRACARFPSWCSTGLIDGTDKCCWSTDEKEVLDSESTLSLPLNDLGQGMEYIVECRSHHAQGTSPFKRATGIHPIGGTSIPGIVYITTLLNSDSSAGDNVGGITFSVSDSLQFVTGISTLTIGIANYIDDDKHEGRNLLGIKCTSGSLTVTECLFPASKKTNGVCILDTGTVSSAGETTEDSAVYSNADSVKWCSLAALTEHTSWQSKGTCAFNPTRLDKHEYCFPTCAAENVPYGNVQCIETNGVFTLENTFECKTSAQINALTDISGPECDITQPLAQVASFAKTISTNPGTCNTDTNKLGRNSACQPECEIGHLVQEGEIKCEKDGSITNTFRCKRTDTIVLSPPLTIGQTYQFQCKLMNQAGWSTLLSTASSSTVKPLSKPSSPTITSVSNGVSSELTVEFEPTSDRTAAASGVSPYTCTATRIPDDSSPKISSANSSPITITGLTDGESYSVKCTATNDEGTSDDSGADPVTVGTMPSTSILTFTEESGRVQNGDSPTSAFIEMQITIGGTAITPSLNKLICQTCDINDSASCFEKSVTIGNADGATITVRIEGAMKAGTTYKVACKGSSDIGQQADWKDISTASSILFKTKPAKPVITETKIHPTEEEKLTVSFTTPELTGSAAIDKYRCGVVSEGQADTDIAWVEIQSLADINMAASAGVSLNVRCQAHNELGWSASDSSVNSYTGIKLPSKMEMKSIDWEADKTLAGISGKMKIFAEPTGDIAHYGTLNCYQCRGFNSSSNIGMEIVDSPASDCPKTNGVQSSMTKFIVSELKLAQSYYFKCRARNSLGWGPWGDDSYSKISANVPPAPTVAELIPSFNQVDFKVLPLADVLSATGLNKNVNTTLLNLEFPGKQRKLKCTVYSYKSDQAEKDESIVPWVSEDEITIERVDVTFSYSQKMSPDKDMINSNLIRVKCQRCNEVGDGPLAVTFSDIVVPGTAITSSIEPVQIPSSLPTKATLKAQIETVLFGGRTYQVAIESMNSTVIAFRATVSSTTTTQTKTDIESKLENDRDLIALFPGVTSIAVKEAEIQSETYNSAYLARIEIRDTNNDQIIQVHHNVSTNMLTETLFVDSVSSLNVEVRIYPHGAQAAVQVSKPAPSYDLGLEEKNEEVSTVNKYCDKDVIQASEVCVSTFDDSGKYDPATTDQYYSATTVIRRPSPEHEIINVVVTAENNIKSIEYNIHLQFNPLKCNCNQTAEYTDPKDNTTIVVVEAAGECNPLTGTCICDPGYAQDEYGNCNNYCPNSCGGVSNGICGTGRCNCQPGWGGPSCEKLSCPICENGGNCTGSRSVCSCPFGYTGARCEQALCKCGKRKNGKCNDALDPTKCVCSTKQWSGPYCEKFLEYGFDDTLRLSFVWGFSQKGKGAVVDPQGKIPVRPLLNSSESLDLSAELSQAHFLEFCRAARSDLSLKVRPMQELQCWVESFAASKGVDVTSNISDISASSFPVAKEKLVTELKDFFDSKKGAEFTAEVDINPDKEETLNIRWVSINIHIDVDKAALSDVLQPTWKKWSLFLAKMNAKAPDSAGYAIMVSSEFTKMDQQLALIGSTINGFMTSNLICLAAVLLFTGDLVISIYTMLSIVLIVITLLGFLFGALGWTFGAIEAVGVTIFVGMSVDYCLHTAHGYAHSASETRKGKVTDALTHIGVSILAAFGTTAGSTLFLFPTWIYLFYQLGVMMFANTILAVMYSFFFLSTLLMACGPTYGCGQITSIITCKCVRTIGKKHHSDGTQLTTEEEEDDDWDPDSLVGQIEAEQRREEQEAKVRLAQKKIDDHNRLQRRLNARKKAAKKKTAVLPVAAPIDSKSPSDDEPEGEEEEGSI